VLQARRPRGLSSDLLPDVLAGSDQDGTVVALWAYELPFVATPGVRIGRLKVSS